jgi:trans-aconitate methyltransferase
LREQLHEELETVKKEYLQPTPDRQVDTSIAQFISDFVISRLSGTRLLELGVGDQIWTPKLVEKFPHVTSIDASQELLDVMGSTLAAKGKADRWTPVTTYFEDYVPEQRFDSMVATYVLEHVDDPAEIIGRANTHWLEPGGLISIVVPHALSLHRRLAVKMGMNAWPGQLGETDRRLGHKNCFTCYDMEKLLVDAGFEIVERRGMFTKLLPNILMVPCSEQQLRGMFELGLDLPIEYSSAIYFQGRKKA